MKGKLILFGILVTVSILLVSGCGTMTATPASSATQEANVSEGDTREPIAGMANPASVYCEEQGGALEIRTTDAGEYGVCVFPDGSECEEWAFFRGECHPGPHEEPAEDVIGMPNPASVYCDEQGGTVEMRTSDAGQHGVCIFPDGGECEEWAFFRGECNPGTPEPEDIVPVEVITEEVEDWVGVVVSNPEGAQFDDYFQMMDQNGTRVGISGSVGAASDDINAQLASLRDTGTVIHVWGIIRHDVPDAYGAQIEVTRLEIE